MATVAIDTAREVRPPRFWESTNGKKVIMAITGFILLLFVLGHMIGNLQVFEGPERLNAYGRFLR
ncbi:MAG: succinate dehydrogenase, partial [Acidobacteriaceae bacterium]|nr:succinate dehydrogenase [Acidobacteriaceae bacterium]